MKVPSSTISSDIQSFCKKASRLSLSHVVDRVSVTEELVLKGESRSKEFKIDLIFYPRAEYEDEYSVLPIEILSSFAHKFPLIFKKELQIELKKLDTDLKSQRAQLGKGRAVREQHGGGDEDDGEEPRSGRRDDDDEESEIGDGDATSSKMKRQRKEQATYEDDEDEDTDQGGEFDDMDIEAAYASLAEDEAEEAAAEPEVDDDRSLAMEHGRVESLFMENLPSATSFSFRESGCTIGLQVSGCRFASAMGNEELMPLA